MTMPLSEMSVEYSLPLLRRAVGEWLKAMFSLRAVSDGPQAPNCKLPDESIVWGRFSQVRTRFPRTGELRRTTEWSSDIPIAIVGGDYAVNWYGHLLRWSALQPRGVPVSAGEWIHTSTSELSSEQKIHAMTQLMYYARQRPDILLQE